MILPTGPENHLTEQARDLPPPSRPTSDGRGGALLARAVGRARWATFWERLWPALATLATAIGLFLAVSWVGLWLALPPLGRAVGLFAFAVLTAAATFPLLFVGAGAVARPCRARARRGAQPRRRASDPAARCT
jgi:hypothetical protein